MAPKTVAMFEEFVTWINVRLTLITYCSKTGPAIGDSQILSRAYQLGTEIGSEHN